EESDSGVLAPAVAAVRLKPRRRLTLGFITAAVLVLAAVGTWLVRSKKGGTEAPVIAVPLTSYTAGEDSPSVASHRKQVAFAWDEGKQGNSHIYVKQIGVEPPFRLTNDPAKDFSPAWSPDGRFIAFLRQVAADKVVLVLAPQRGGQERILAENNANVE